jgi:hypothetical protein
MLILGVCSVLQTRDKNKNPGLLTGILYVVLQVSVYFAFNKSNPGLPVK